MTRYTLDIGEKTIEAELLQRTDTSIAFLVNGVRYEVGIRPTAFSGVQNAAELQNAPVASSGPITTAPSSNCIASPMPGIIVKVLVKPKDTVARGQAVIVVEAMKMENNIISPRDGVIAAVLVKEGQEVNGRQVLIEFA